ncbi:L,D-transpeptidase [Methylosinus sp. H3A]|uniref:L,D-transpeptidase n=1 Tax=Methylosinus sp. H3A TaxID=2785786 RepID=UPI0018C24BB3|nr:L,D-transpeptidase [Methylosinus sp. H3A]MBG0809039.1 L,D-transpeptidase [Methylosinus sp. H3A]
MSFAFSTRGAAAACFAAVAATAIVVAPAARAESNPFLALFEGRSVAAPTQDARVAREYPTSTRALVEDPTGQPAGTITVDTKNRQLYLSLPDGRAMRYGVGVAREGFAWNGQTRIGRMAQWPDWTPPAAMMKRRPDLPRHMEGGENNPLGARALYLYSGERDTMFRIHGSNEPWSIGQAVSSGCIRMLNEDVSDLFDRVKLGAQVIVL